jgi:ABC-type phosphonate transport system ATPase subunit
VGEEAEDDVNRDISYGDDSGLRQQEGREKHRANLRARKQAWLEEKARRAKSSRERENQ